MGTPSDLPCNARVLALLASSTATQAQTVTPVDVLEAGGQTVHARLVFEVREAITRSPRFTLEQNAPLKITIVSIASNGDDGKDQVASAVSFVSFKDDGHRRLLDQRVLLTGLDRARDQAENVLAHLDTEVQKIPRNGGS